MNEGAGLAAAPPEHPRTLSVRGATVLGIGSMIGAGIFALLGEAGAVAGAAVWISFLVGGIVALLLGYVCAKLGVRYPSFGSHSRLGAKGGLVITTALVLLVANLVNLSAIASVGSAVSLIVFVLVGAAGYRRRADTGSSTMLVVLAVAVTAVVLGFFVVDIIRNDPGTFVAIVAIVAVILDGVFRRRVDVV